MELGGETAKNGNTASYSFTFLGEKYGIKGSGTLAVISAEVLNDESLSIGQDNMKVKLVQKVGDTVENYSFKFLGYNDKSNTEVSGGDNLNINNNGNSQSNSSNNSSLSTESNENNKTEIDSNKEKIEATEFNGGNSNNTEESTYENGEALESCSEEADNTKDNVNDIDGKENSEEKDLLASKGSNKGILITSEIILTLVVAGGVAGYYFYKKRNKLS